MDEDLRQPNDYPAAGTVEQPLYTPTGHDAPASLALGVSAVPVAAFTASLLFDVLSIFAESPDQAHTYNSGAANLAKVGLGAAFVTLALELIDSLDVPAATAAGRAVTKRLALDGAVVAVYLLNVAAREKQLADPRTQQKSVASAPIGLSLVGLTLLGAAGKLPLRLLGLSRGSN